MRKVEELTNKELLDSYFHWLDKYYEIDYNPNHSEEYIKHVEKQFDRVEKEALRRMGEKENEQN